MWFHECRRVPTLIWLVGSGIIGTMTFASRGVHGPCRGAMMADESVRQFHAPL